VAVEALASENRADARAFVAHELRGIDDDSASSLHIRETIAAYFAAEHNAASAAAALGIHQQTVANRLRAAEDRLGRPVGARRVELETALRLRACLDRQWP
jgi:DNA-binding PucR family transcriptional regulator